MNLRQKSHLAVRALTALAVCLPLGAVAQEPPAALTSIQAPFVAAPAALPSLTPAQAAQVLKVLRAAGQHGLQTNDYLPEGMAQIDQPDSAQQMALAAAALSYARDVRIGRLAENDFPKLWGLRPAAYDPAPEFAAAVAADRVGPWLEGLDPPYAGYAALKRALTRYREIGAKGGWAAIPAGPSLSLGATGPRVDALRARLAAEDDKVAKTGSFDTELQAALIRAQRRFGLKPDGVAGVEALSMLNKPVGQRALQIQANMERWRWLPRAMPATRVQVNSGAAIVTLFRDDKAVLSMKAVSGRPGGDETPMLASEIHSVVVNPPWNVPTSIANEELWPKERANPGYLKRAGYSIIPTEGGGRRLQQKAGDTSALGRFKFDFLNDYAVYLHDTPSKGGFDRYARNASHGCVRVEKPRELAEALLAGNAQWDTTAIDAALGKGATVRASLPEKVPVYILYWTAFAGADGQMHFRSDPYDWDRMLLQKVGVLERDKAPAAVAD